MWVARSTKPSGAAETCRPGGRRRRFSTRLSASFRAEPGRDAGDDLPVLRPRDERLAKVGQGDETPGPLGARRIDRLRTVVTDPDVPAHDLSADVPER